MRARCYLVPLGLALMFVGSGCSRSPAEVAAATLKERGAGLGYTQMGSERHVTAVALLGPQYDDGDLALLADLPQLRQVTVHGATVTVAGLTSLQQLPRLRQLDVLELPWSAGLRDCLAGFPRLESLGVDGGGITEHHLAELRGLLPEVLLVGRPRPPVLDAISATRR